MGLNDNITNGCTGSGCSGGQCTGGGCGSGSCGGSGCSNNPADSIECTDKIVLDKSGYTGGIGVDLIRKRLNESLQQYYDYKCSRKTIDEVHYIDTKIPCNNENAIRALDSRAYRCINGTWHYADAAILQDKNQIYETKKHQEPLYLKIGAGASPCKEEPIYDHHGCIVGYKPFLVAEGEFGVWETSEIYPFTKNCGEVNKVGDCEYVYGEEAGKNVRLFRTPSVSSESFYIGGRDGVPNRYEGGGLEDDGAYVFMIGLRVEGLTPPKYLPKPLCKENWATITYVERTESNKSVIGSGILKNTFIGDMSGVKHAVPKIGLNSPDYYDVHINNNNTFYRGGEGENPVPAYVFHSPDMHLRRPHTDAYRIILEGEEHGEGFRYGLYDRGEIPSDFYKEQEQQKGARSAMNLSRFTRFSEPIVRCVKAFSQVRADTVLSNGDKFTYPLLNTYKESCSYIELNPGSGKVQLLNRGTFNPEPSGDIAFTDESFIGDTKNAERILKGAATYATVTRYIPNQYGSPILQTFIPIGLEVSSTDGVPNSGAHGLCGDSFVNAYNIKTTHFVSDKVPDVIVSWPVDPDVTELKTYGKLMKFLWKILGIRGWGELPSSGNEGQFSGFLHLGTRNGARNRKGQDIYYPSVHTQSITAYFHSDCNLEFRQTGSPDLGQVHTHRLKGLNRDSSLPYGSKWQLGWLNRFHIPWNKPSGFKKLFYTIALFAFVYIIGGTVIINGINDMSQIIVGLSTSVMAWVVSIIEVLFGIAWIVLWSLTSEDNKIIANALGIDLQFPDIRYSGNVNANASNRSMKEGRGRGFENMYHKINHDYSIPNIVEKGFGMSDPYITCMCPCEKTNEIFHSNRQNQGSFIDAWANFKTNNFLKIDAGLGHISKIFELYGELWAHTTDHLVKLVVDRGYVDTDVMGSSKFIRDAIVYRGGVPEGCGGLLDPNAAEVTKWGYLFPDRKSRDWYLFNGSQLESIGQYGLSQFFNENMEFELLKQIPEFNLVDKKIEGGIGYSVGVDHENGYVFLTKLDYTTKEKDKKVAGPDGCMISTPLKPDCNKSWTVTFDIEKKQWVGFEYFTPYIYAWNRFSMYNMDDSGLWRHNVKGKFNEWNGKHYPSMIEVVVTDPQTYDDFDYQSTIIDTEAYKWKDYDYIRSTKTTFDHLIAYNSHQNTGYVELFNNNDDISIIERSRGRIDSINLEFKGRRWHFSELIDKLINHEEHQFLKYCAVKPRELNTKNLGAKEKNYNWNDNFLAYRFYFGKHKDIKLFLKNIQTLIDAEHEVQ